MNSIVHLIKLVEKKPAMYIGIKSISRLQSFIDGWCFRDRESIIDIDVMDKFQKWIEKEYGVSSSHSWSNIILFYSREEHIALDEFFRLFEKFLNCSSQTPRRQQSAGHGAGRNSLTNSKRRSTSM